jgi:periplasmic protein TonB
VFVRLLESKRNGERSVWGAVVSTVAHTAVIALAVFATAQARAGDPPKPDVVVWVEPPVVQPAAPVAPIAPADRSDRQPPIPAPDPLVVDRIDVVIPPVDLTPSLPASGPAIVSSAGNDSSRAEPAVGVASNQPFTGDQVERQVSLRPGSSPPRYPSALRAAGIEGQVIALFVVSEAGRVEPATVRFTLSDNPLFEDAVRSALERMRFAPAEVDGRKVRQLVQMPFVFTLTR